MNNLDINKDDLSQVELTETVGNIYTEVFLKHKIEQLITVAEKNKENKWMLFNQVIRNHEAFYNFECESCFHIPKN